MIDLKELRAICLAATGGKWDCKYVDFNKPYITSTHAGYSGICALYHKTSSVKTHVKDNAEANVRFIAATDPQTVIELIDKIERYRTVLEKITAYDCDWCDDDAETMYHIAKQALKGLNHDMLEKWNTRFDQTTEMQKAIRELRETVKRSLDNGYSSFDIERALEKTKKWSE